MKRILYALLVASLMMGTAQAGTILLVSDANDPGTAGGDHEDDAYVTWLASLGHTVDTSGMNKAMREGLDAGDKAAIEAADLVIVTRRTSSGSYDNDRKYWNEVSTPLILHGGHLTRGEGSNRWGWTSNGGGTAGGTETDMDIVDAQSGHAFVAGIADPAALFDLSTVPGNTFESDERVYMPNAGNTHAGTVIGTFGGMPILIDIPTGTDLDALNGTTDKYGTTTARRAFFASWGYDHDPDVDPAEWGDYYTANYTDVLENMVGTLIPEPATLTLLGLGLGAMLIRRRK